MALSANQPALYTIYGSLCNPSKGPSHTVQLLLSGSTYTHVYWDWPYENPILYSAVRYFTASGYSTFNIDNIGVGASSHPTSDQVTVASSAYVMHEIVGRLRDGSIGGTAFSHVISIGHSFGGGIATAEAALYHDVDAVIIESWFHTINPAFLGLLNPMPANLDPSGRFASLDSGYLTTASAYAGDDSTRANAFYYAPGSDPNVIADDERSKDTLTGAEAATITDFFTGKYSLNVTVPVLMLVGNKDAFFCTNAIDCSSERSVYNEERPFFSSQAQLQVHIIPATGHDLNLHYTAPLTYAEISLWSLAHVAP